MVEGFVQMTRHSKADFYEMIGELERRRDAAIREPQLPLKRLSKYVSRSVTERSQQPPPECTTCGLCCSFALIVPIRTDEAERLPEHWGITVDDFVIERVLGRNLETGCCEHLDGTLGETIGCRIYEKRPDVCREFEPGSDRCLEYRRMYGLDPQLTDDELRAASAAFDEPTRRNVITHSEINVASVRASMEMTDDGVKVVKRHRVKMIVAVDHDPETVIELHDFDPAVEEWHETEFFGLTLDEARETIAKRTASAVL